MSDLAANSLRAKFAEYERLMRAQRAAEEAARERLLAALIEWHESVISKRHTPQQIAQNIRYCSGLRLKLSEVAADRDKVRQTYLPYYRQEWQRVGLLQNRPDLLSRERDNMLRISVKHTAGKLVARGGGSQLTEKYDDSKGKNEQKNALAMKLARKLGRSSEVSVSYD